MEVERPFLKLLPFGIRKKILNLLNSENNLNLELNSYILHNMLDFYNYGRFEGNLFMVIDRNKCAYTKISGLNEDLETFRKDYFADAKKNMDKHNHQMSNSFDNTNINEFFYNTIKRNNTERMLETTYMDKWLMYNKLFSNSKQFK